MNYVSEYHQTSHETAIKCSTNCHGVLEKNKDIVNPFAQRADECNMTSYII